MLGLTHPGAESANFGDKLLCERAEFWISSAAKADPLPMLTLFD
jgi:hypothetical protein